MHSRSLLFLVPLLVCCMNLLQAQELRVWVKNVSEVSMENVILFGDTIPLLQASEIKSITPNGPIVTQGTPFYSMTCTINGLKKEAAYPNWEGPICGTGISHFTEGHFFMSFDYREVHREQGPSKALVLVAFESSEAIN